MRRREVIALIGGAAAWPLMGRAQQRRTKDRRVGFLHPGRSAVVNMRAASFFEGLSTGAGREEGWELVMRIGDGETVQMAAMAAELVALQVQAIVAVSPSAVHAAYGATRAIPIVAVDLESDPVHNGWAASLAHPAGNVTGIFLDLPELGAKCVQLLREAVPTLSTLDVLWDPATGSVPLDELTTIMASLSLPTKVHEVRRAADFQDAFRVLAQAQNSGVLMLPSPLISSNVQLLADLTLAHRVPAITLFPEFAQKGGLLAYGPDLATLFRQRAH